MQCKTISPCRAWGTGRGHDACGGWHNAAAAAGAVRGVVAWSIINSEVILAWSVKGGRGREEAVFQFYISFVVAEW